jgi:hypothetical protein
MSKRRQQEEGGEGLLVLVVAAFTHSKMKLNGLTSLKSWRGSRRLLTLSFSPFAANSFRISLCFSVEKNMKELLKRRGACGAFVYFTTACFLVIMII